MTFGNLKETLDRAVREGVTLFLVGPDRLRYQARGRPLSVELRTLLVEHKEQIITLLCVQKTFSNGGPCGGDRHGVHGVHAQAEEVASVDTVGTVATDNPEPPHQENFFNSWSEVDGVTVVVCKPYDEAKALIAEMLADAAGKPVALDIETTPTRAERAHLAVLEEERAAVNDEAIAFRAAGKKAGTPQAEVDAHTETANAQLKALAARIDHAESAGLDPHRSEIRLVQAYGGGRRAAVIDIAKAGPEALGLLQGVSAVIHNAPFDLAHLGHRGVNLGRVHDTLQAAKLTLGANKCSLASAVKHYLKTDLSKELQASDWASQELSEDQIRYAARDVIWLWRLCPPLFADLGPQTPAYRIQAAAAPAIARMNNAGIAFDADRHAGALRALAEAEETARADFRAACLEIGKPELALAVPQTPQEIAAVLKAILTDARAAPMEAG